MAKRRREDMTNIDVITDLMNFSRYGALAQMFVIDALTKHAKAVAEADVEKLGPADGLVNREAWKGVAREIADKLDAFYGGKR